MTGENSYSFTYGLNAEGQLQRVTYPSGRTISYCLDTAGRPVHVRKGEGDICAEQTMYVSGAQYSPSGAISQLTLGNGVTETAEFNSRQQLKSLEAAKNESLWKLENFYCPDQAPTCASNNGNVVGQRLAAPKKPEAGGGLLTISTGYGYDAVNRLASAVESGSGTGWSQTFTYDRYGNQGVTQEPLDVAPVDLHCGSYGADNRCTANFQYDNGVSGRPGNITGFPGGRTAAYDAENRQIALTDGGTWQYFYDGEGRRVKKVGGSGTVVYIYDAAGQLAVEYDSAPTEPAPCATCYLTADHLGSTRLITDPSGAPQRRYDFLPFGWDLNTGYGDRLSVTGYVASDHMNPRFTGKQRDSESGLGLDYFGVRYFSGAQGRFTSADPENRGGRVPDPQSWNMYSYVRNNPLLYTDPTGETYQICVKDDQDKDKCIDVSDEQFAELQQNPGNGISLSNGDINAFVNGVWTKVGTYWQTDVDLPLGVGMALYAAGASADAEIKKFARDVAIGVGAGLVAGVVIGAAAEGVGALPRVLPFKDAELIQRVSRALTRIAQGAKMYSRDGISFQNREGLLPVRGPGYYTEYTVEPAAGGAGRGAERLVLGKGGEIYYTPNHYGSFVRIQ